MNDTDLFAMSSFAAVLHTVIVSPSGDTPRSSAILRHASRIEFSSSLAVRSSSADATRNAYSLRPVGVMLIVPHASGLMPVAALLLGPVVLPARGGQAASRNNSTRHCFLAGTIQ